MIARTCTRRAPRCLRLCADNSGLAITEFAFVAPIFFMMLMGIFDLGFAYYAQAALQGAVQDGARKASLENTLWTDIQKGVTDQVKTVLPSSDPNTKISFAIDSTFYENYNDINLPEDFEDKERDFRYNGTYDVGEPYTDSNRNGKWDPGESFTDKLRGTKNNIYDPDECYVDRNANNKWDADVGIAGRGGAQDVVSIRAQVTFTRIFPLWRMVGQPQDLTLSATSFLRNQPFSAQSPRVGVRKCP